MPCVECTAEEEPVSGDHVEIVVLVVVLAAAKVGEEPQRVVVVLGLNAKLQTDGRVDEVAAATSRMLPQRKVRAVIRCS